MGQRAVEVRERRCQIVINTQQRVLLTRYPLSTWTVSFSDMTMLTVNATTRAATQSGAVRQRDGP
jgi:hypothetical protein